MFILYDGRAKSGDTDGASVFDTAETEEEARQSGRDDWAGHDAIWFQYDVDGKTLTNGQPRWDLPPASAPPKKRRKKNRNRGRKV